MKKIILASASPRRREILKKFSFKFRVIIPQVDEESIINSLRHKNPFKTACAVAREKAHAVAGGQAKGTVLGADTIVVLGKRIIGKPKSKKDAFRILSALSNSKHRVITAIALVDALTGRELVAYESTEIRFRKMASAEIKKYINNNNVMDKAGAYAIQEGADPYISSYKGSYHNIVGLPVEKLQKVLKLWDKL